MEHQQHLTKREREVLVLVAQAKTNREIGIALVIAEATVQNHLRNIFEKLGATSRIQAVLKANLLANPNQPRLNTDSEAGSAAD